MMTKRDPHGNIVRGTIAALAAAVGGADAVTVLPFSAALGLPDAHARRIARNTQTILIEEANLHRVADPAAGSGAIESAHRCALCEVAWTLFQDIEREGGASRGAGERLDPDGRRQGARRAREANIASRKDTLIGTSDFPDLAEDRSPCWRAPRLRLSSSPQEGAAPHQARREPFERLRDRSDAYLAKHWRAAEGVSRLPRPRRRFQRAGELRQEPVRVRRHRGGGRKGRQPRETIQGIGREARLPLLLGQGLCQRRREAAEGADQGRRQAHLSRGQARREQAGACKRRALAAFLHQGCDTLEILNAAYDEM